MDMTNHIDIQVAAGTLPNSVMLADWTAGRPQDGADEDHREADNPYQFHFVLVLLSNRSPQHIRKWLLRASGCSLGPNLHPLTRYSDP